MEKFPRADRVLVELGHFDSRATAQAAIRAGGVSANGAAITRPAQPLDPAAAIVATPAHPYVSRGGLKLAHALEIWPEISVKDAVCLDIGASTGGFTDVLLARGAGRVTAVDVGTGQLHPRLSGDARVVSLEQTDARDLTATQVGAPSLVVCDASFIALEKLLGPVIALLPGGCDLVLLFKPQFQVGRAHIGRGGIVRDAAAVAGAELAFTDWLAARGCPARAVADSPITGGDGNRERLVWARVRT